MNKRKTRILLLLMAVVILINQLTFGSSALVFSDTSTHWGKTYIDRMTDLGIMDYSNTINFYPNGYFSRKEAAKSACMLFKEKTLTSSPHPFTDVPTSNAYSKYVKWVYDNGVMNGTAANTFEPDTYIRRQDMCVVLYNLYFERVGVPYKPYYSNVTFSDDSDISAYAKTKVYKLQRIGVVSGDGGAFRPRDYITRAEAASLLYKLWDYGMVLSTPQQLQINTLWCWAASSHIIAKYRHENSRTMQEIANQYVSGQNLALPVNAIAGAASYATRNNIDHSYSYNFSHNDHLNCIANYKPAIVVVLKDNDEIAHAMVLIGYVRHPTDINETRLFIYDVWDGAYKWVTYNEYVNGTMKFEHWYGYKKFMVVYSL